MRANLRSYIFWFLGLLFFQFSVLSNLYLGDYFFPFIYILLVLILPRNIPHWTLLLVGFFLGITVDVFLTSYGTHAFATTLIAFIRPYILNTLFPGDSTVETQKPTLQNLGFQKFLIYCAILVSIHHLTVLIIDELRIDSIFRLIAQWFCSGVLTIFIMLCLEYIFKGEASK